MHHRPHCAERCCLQLPHKIGTRGRGDSPWPITPTSPTPSPRLVAASPSWPCTANSPNAATPHRGTGQGTGSTNLASLRSRPRRRRARARSLAARYSPRPNTTAQGSPGLPAPSRPHLGRHCAIVVMPQPSSPCERPISRLAGRRPCTLGHRMATTLIRTAGRRTTARGKRPVQSPAEQNRYRLQTSDLRIAMHRPHVPDGPESQGQPEQETPGQRPDLGFTSEPPSGFEPETYALRDRERSCRGMPCRTVS
ncbi:hypothetical protein YUWDRAFT_04386 [Streptomyces sp. AmelKG-D3]|nr:hypothetical protein YUWDRAFT_04386 [Streptomyces sp. AmelKG-D3]